MVLDDYDLWRVSNHIQLPGVVYILRAKPGSTGWNARNLSSLKVLVQLVPVQNCCVVRVRNNDITRCCVPVHSKGGGIGRLSFHKGKRRGVIFERAVSVVADERRYRTEQQKIDI